MIGDEDEPAGARYGIEFGGIVLKLIASFCSAAAANCAGVAVKGIARRRRTSSSTPGEPGQPLGRARAGDSSQIAIPWRHRILLYMCRLGCQARPCISRPQSAVQLLRLSA